MGERGGISRWAAPAQRLATTFALLSAVSANARPPTPQPQPIDTVAPAPPAASQPAVDPAEAERGESARIHFQAGREYYAEQRYRQAAREFVEAYRLSPRPELLFNIGRSYEALKLPREAAGCYREFLARGQVVEPGELEARNRVLEAEARSPALQTCALAVPEAVVLTSTPAPPPPRPLYKAWWLWTVVGTLVVGTAAGVAAGLATRPPSAFTLPEVR